MARGLVVIQLSSGFESRQSPYTTRQRIIHRIISAVSLVRVQSCPPPIRCSLGKNTPFRVSTQYSGGHGQVAQLVEQVKQWSSIFSLCIWPHRLTA